MGSLELRTDGDHLGDMHMYRQWSQGPIWCLSMNPVFGSRIAPQSSLKSRSHQGKKVMKWLHAVLVCGTVHGSFYFRELPNHLYQLSRQRQSKPSEPNTIYHTVVDNQRTQDQALCNIDPIHPTAEPWAGLKGLNPKKRGPPQSPTLDPEYPSQPQKRPRRRSDSREMSTTR